MQRLITLLSCLAGLSIPACATVQIVSLKPSVPSPQLLGTSVTWTVTATDSSTGPLTFQFNVAPPQGTFTNGLAKDFNAGTLNSGTWTSQPFAWVPTQIEGLYQIQVVIKDFASGESTSKTIPFHVTPLATGSVPVVTATANPLVALFSTPACPSGSTMRVYFQEQSKSTPGTTTNFANCHAAGTMNFEIAGMYPSTTYQMLAQTDTNGTTTNGTVVRFTTGPLPSSITFPTFTPIVPPGAQTDTALKVFLHDPIKLGGNPYLGLATDLSGKIVWYYTTTDPSPYILVTRPLVNGGMLSIQNGMAWNPATQLQQLVRQTDLAGNIVRETNTGAIQRGLIALGATGLGPCNAFSVPAPVGSSCLGAFHHDAIQSLPNGYTALLADVERIFPAGTQGDTSGLPVDIVGDAIVVLNHNWQVVWYFNTFEHDSGAPQLDINRPAVLGETCIANQTGCPPMFLLSTGIAPKAKDWLHANSLYYWPTDHFGGASGDIVWSSRHQDWIMKIDYNNGSGTGNILWRMGLDGDFTFNNIYADPWPWFSHQHDAGVENNGTGVITIFDNGNTRVSPPPVGLGSGDSRGMALSIDESTLQVTPVLSADLGYFSTAMGSAQLLSNANYFFMPAVVTVSISNLASYGLEILPTPGTDTGTTVLNLQSQEAYRGWQMISLYSPPTT